MRLFLILVLAIFSGAMFVPAASLAKTSSTVQADAVPFAPGRLVRGEGAGRPPQRVRRPCGEDRVRRLRASR